MAPRDDTAQAQPRSSVLLNVDLEVESQHDLQPLVEALSPAAYSIERPPGRACFELNSAVAPTDPETLILEFISRLEALSPVAQLAWDRASKRVFDIGFQSARQPLQQTHSISAETLKAVAALRAAIAVTIYAPEPDDR